MNSEDLVKELYDFLLENKGRKIDISELRRLCGSFTTTQILDLLEMVKKEYNIEIYYNKSERKVSTEKEEGFRDIEELNRVIKVGLISHPRLISRYSSIGALYAAYEVFKLEGVVWIDLINLFNDTSAYKREPNRKLEYLPEMENLSTRINYVAKIFPRIEGVKTHVVPTKRDIALFRSDGGRMIEVNQVRELCKLRDDIRLEEREFQEVYRTNVRIYLLSAHNDDGVTSSYTRDAQERVGKIKFDKNYYNIVVIGGYHVPFEIPDYGGADYVISLPSLIRQTAYMRGVRRVAPFIGCYVLELRLGDRRNGIRKLEALKTRLYNLERYAKPNDFYEYPQVKDSREKKLVDTLFIRSPITMGELCRSLNMKEDEIRSLISKINEREKRPIITEEEHRFFIKLPYKQVFEQPKIVRGEKYKLLFISDTHLNSNYVNKDDVNYILNLAKSEGVTAVFHCGDVLEVVPGFEIYDGQRYKVRTQSAKEIINYLYDFFDTFREYGLPLYFITGNHDTKAAKVMGLDIVYLISHMYEKDKGTNLIRYVGEERGTVDLGDNLRVNMVHPSRGSAETLGYNVTRFYKFIKSLGNNNNNLSRILLIGNYHKALFLYDPLHFPAYLVPCIKYPDDYVETKGLTIQKGAWMSTFEIDKEGRIVMIENRYVRLPMKEYEKPKILDERARVYDKIV